VFILELENGRWTSPRPAPFESRYQDWDYHFAPDGSALYFTSMRPTEAGAEPPQHGNIWKAQILASGWSDPMLLEPPINGPDHHDSSPSLTADGTLYFFSSRQGGYGGDDIYCSRLIDGAYREVNNLGAAINTEHHEYDLVVAPDESFLVFSSTRPGGHDDVDLYVSFRGFDGAWSEPRNLGEAVNATGAVFPSLTDDGKYLFFQSRPNDCGTIFWVDARVIHEQENDFRTPRR
jgi:Tol biopolymer transport system component